MVFKAVVLCTLLFSAVVFAEPKDQELKNLLHKQVSSGHVNLGYDKSRTFIFSVFYPYEQNGVLVVKDVYCEKEYQVPGPREGFPEGSILNIEHTWPQSKFTGKFPKDVQKADLHHLFPSDSRLNSDRANHPFGDVAVEKKPLKCPISHLGSEGGSKQTVFEPPQAHKGNVARAIFYFSVRYQASIDANQEATLKKWNQEDPVDDEEMARNDEISKIQKNRNPFIDDADLVDQISDF